MPSAQTTADALHILCPACRTTNRVPADRPAGRAKCGSCHRPLFTGHPVEVDEAGFRAHLRHDDLPLLVDMWAPWCGPCRMMAPHFDRAAGVLEPGFRLLKLNIDEAQAVAGEYAVQSIPTLFLFRRGRVVDQLSGAQGAEAIIRWAQSARGESYEYR